MKKVIAYAVASGKSTDQLEEDVYRAIEEGYQPFGNMVMVTSHTDNDGVTSMWILQPVVMYEDNED